MTIAERHEQMSTPSAYGGVNGVNPRFVAQSFRQLLDQTLSALVDGRIISSVLFRCSESTPFRIIVLSIALTQDALANSQSPRVRLKKPHDHGRTV